MSSLNYQNLVVLAPQSLDSLLPLEIIDDTSAVRAAFVEKYGIHSLPDNWKNSCGFYILFSPLRDDNSFEAYVGKATNGFFNRLNHHYDDKSWWRTAMLVYRDTTAGFSSTQSSYLEGRMRDILDLSPHVTVHNIASTGDRTLPEWEKPAMESVVLSALRIMFLRGYRNASMGFVADMITADTVDGFKPARTAPVVPPLLEKTVTRRPVLVANDMVFALPEQEKKFAALRDWRKQVSKDAGISAYLVFNNKELQSIVEKNPASIEELLSVHGVGQMKADKYGPEVLSILRRLEKGVQNPVMDSAPPFESASEPAKGLFGWM